MNLIENFFTKNKCYTEQLGKVNRIPTGIQIHSTGANNKQLRRYCHNDPKGLIGVNQYGNHWNTPTPGGQRICASGFIGVLADGSVATVQTLPWTFNSWLSGSGSKGNANFLGYVGFEICEDDKTGKDYFNKIYKETLELCAYLCKKYSIKVENVRDHAELYKMGIASNHSDVGHWFTKHGKSMDMFRADLAKLIVNVDVEVKEVYRVRTYWENPSSQIGAYKILENAKKVAEDNKFFKVFDWTGKIVYDPWVGFDKDSESPYVEPEPEPEPEPPIVEPEPEPPIVEPEPEPEPPIVKPEPEPIIPNKSWLSKLIDSIINFIRSIFNVNTK